MNVNCIKSDFLNKDQDDNLVCNYENIIDNKFSFSWNEIKEAKSYSVLIVDYSTSKLLGHPSICLSVSNIKKNNLSLSELNNNNTFIIGSNSSIPSGEDGVIIECMPKKFLANSSNKSNTFMKMFDLESPHFCKIFIFAISNDLTNLKNGYFISDLNNFLIGNVLETLEISFYMEGGLYDK